MIERVIVELGERSYDIQIGTGVRENAPRSAMLITDSNVDKLYGEWAAEKTDLKYVFQAKKTKRSRPLPPCAVLPPGRTSAGKAL